MSAVDAPSDVQAERMGRRIRRLRHARGLTLVQLASAAELSHPFLSQLERGLARPSIASLEKIARALGSSQLELLAGAEDEPTLVRLPAVDVVRTGDGTRGRYGEGEARMLVHHERPFHPLELCGDNVEFGDSFTHAEDEFLYVVAGDVEVDLAAARHRLSAGDSVYYAGGTPHRFRSLSPAGYRLLIVKQHPARL